MSKTSWLASPTKAHGDKINNALFNTIFCDHSQCKYATAEKTVVFLAYSSDKFVQYAPELQAVGDFFLEVSSLVAKVLQLQVEPVHVQLHFLDLVTGVLGVEMGKAVESLESGKQHHRRLPRHISWLEIMRDY